MAAEQGYARAQANLGHLFAEGLGLAKSDAEAVAWFRRAAEQGNAVGQYNLGLMHLSGRGVAKNTDEAFRLFKLAADQGNVDAQTKLEELKKGGGWRFWRPFDEKDAERERKASEQERAEEERRREQARRERRRREEDAERERQKREEEARSRRAPSERMSKMQALETLALKPGSSEHEIRAAYARLIKRLHPDVGGTEGLAKQLNAARDTLLNAK